MSRSAVAQWETGRAGQVTTNLTRVAAVLGWASSTDVGATVALIFNRRRTRRLRLYRSRRRMPICCTARRLARLRARVSGAARRGRQDASRAIRSPASHDDRHRAGTCRRYRRRRERQTLGQRCPPRGPATSRLARPTGDTICLIAAASGLIALSSARGRPARTGDRRDRHHQRRRLYRRLNLRLTVSIADRIATTLPDSRPRAPDRWHLHYVIVLERRRDVHRGIGDDQRVEMPGHIHDEAMADPSLSADSVSRAPRGHQLIGVQAALH